MQSALMRRSLDALWALAAATGGVAVVEWAGHRQWHLWDLSMVVDAGWRTYLGQRPSVDFISSLPVGFHALGGLSLWLFGVSWSSFVHIAALWTCLCIGWEFALLRAMGISRPWALGIAVAVCSVTVVQKSFLYHSSFTTPIAAVLITASFLALRQPSSFLAVASVGAASATLFLGKQNAILNVLLVATLALSTPRLRLGFGAALLLAIGAAVGVVLLVAGSLGPVVRATLVAGTMRGGPNLTALLGVLDLGTRAFVLDTMCVALAFSPLLAIGPRRMVGGLAVRERVLCMGAALIALYGMSTNNDLKMTDLPPLLVAIFVPVALDSCSRVRQTHLVLVRPAVALGAIVVIGLVAGMTRMTLWGDAGRVFGSAGLSRAGPEGTFFAGLWAGPRLASIERDITAISAETGSRKTGVFFGPALEFGYAAHGYTPPLGLPVWWHPGTSYPPAQSQEIAARFAADAPTTAVFLLNDWPGMPPRIYEQLLMDYSHRVVGTLMVFERRATGSLDSVRPESHGSPVMSRTAALVLR
jgi:hypothetical protein